MRLRKLIILLIISISSNLAGQAQNITTLTAVDTICKPVPEYKLIFKDAQKYRYTDSLLKIAEAQVKELEGQIRLLTDKDIELKIMYDGQLEALHQEIDIYKDQIKGYERLLRKQKRKTFFTAAGGVLATGLTLFLYLQK